MSSDNTVDSLAIEATSMEVSWDNIPEKNLQDFTIREVILSESLLSPTLQTSIKVQSYIHSTPRKSFDDFKGAYVNINVKRPMLKLFGYPEEFKVRQKIYRLGGRSSTSPNTTDNRKMVNHSVEEMVFHACDPTLLDDAATLVSKSWKCTRPSTIVSEVLQSCAGAKALNIETCDPARDYIAENIHPFQIIDQQSNVALAGGNDPSFVHFMTYENYGTHHFRSLYNMAKQEPIITLRYADTGNSYKNPNAIMNYVFPCDFDLLSDILNGAGSEGNINSMMLFNPANKSVSLYGPKTIGCGIGQGNFKIAMSNDGTELSQNMCPDYTKTYLQKRQARMGLLEKDKIALRLTVPWNSIYNAGKIINIELLNPENKEELNYGSGKYLIMAMIHNIRSGGYSTITMDCVSHAVGQGEV